MEGSRDLKKSENSVRLKNRHPHFIIIGAQKSGTTWIVDMLRDHKDVFIPREEVHYFNSNYERGDNWYLSHFSEAGEGQQIGEKTPDYLSGGNLLPENDSVAKRIHQRLPDAKLIVVLRDPVSRAISAYNHYVRTRIISPLQNINAYFLNRKFEDDDLGVVDYGHYHVHLSPYEAVFSPDQLLVLYYEDMMNEKQATMDKVCAFIGVDTIEFPNLELRSNAFKKSRLGLIVHYYVPFLKRLGWQLDKILPTNKQNVNDSVKQFLIDHYSQTIAVMKDKMGYVPKKWIY